jgi:hypothetical protein
MLSLRRIMIMVELKTLKDLYGKYAFYTEETEDDFFNELKQEAIKWVKAPRLVGLFELQDVNKLEGAIKFIKLFFNLTEEDITKLKETTNGK